MNPKKAKRYFDECSYWLQLEYCFLAYVSGCDRGPRGGTLFELPPRGAQALLASITPPSADDCPERSKDLGFLLRSPVLAQDHEDSKNATAPSSDGYDRGHQCDFDHRPPTNNPERTGRPLPNSMQTVTRLDKGVAAILRGENSRLPLASNPAGGMVGPVGCEAWLRDASTASSSTSSVS